VCVWWWGGLCPWQIGGSSGCALSDEDRKQIMDAARTERAVGLQGARFFEDSYELKTGRPKDAARGLEDRMRADLSALYAIIDKGIDGIVEETQGFTGGTPEYCAELREIVDYIVNQRTSEKAYPNGIRDKGRGSVRSTYFIAHIVAQEARLSDAEVLALRIYTTLVYKDMNNPLRDDARHALRASVPLPAISRLADNAIRKLRSVRANLPAHEAVVPLWRGMRNVRVTPEFMRQGGTELAFMSTTTDLRVAVRYALSRHSLLFKIVAPNFMSLGADLQWLSAFPGEAEVLFPPLTFLEPTGRTDRVDTVDCDGNLVTFTVVELTPYF
jgi:hypothetical protein